MVLRKDYSMLKAALILLAAASFGNATTIPGAPAGVNDGSSYAIPYQTAIDGVSQLVTCCNNFFDEAMTGDIGQASIGQIGGAAGQNATEQAFVYQVSATQQNVVPTNALFTPEPSSIALFGVGTLLLGVGCFGSRARSRSVTE
jgi:hypothetical protein